jgi:Xaa-Pro dipeptidase
MVYFTGLHFHLGQRPTLAVITRDELGLIVPSLEAPKLDARPDLNARRFLWTDRDGYMGAFRAALDEMNLHGATLGVDGMTMRVTELFALLQIDNTLGVAQIERQLTRIRAMKTTEEVESFRKAIRISEGALDKLLGVVKPGMTERQMAARLDEEMRALGGEGLSFETMVQTGPNSANPHGFLTERPAAPGEFLLIDYGSRINGYPADITRTFAFAEPSAEMRKIHETVLRANEAARNLAGPGIQMGAVDKAARDVIRAAGYGDYFTHRTGHGLGLEGHEAIPQIAEGVQDMLEPGMMFTIEPGIYVPGLGGVRIEDNVLVTATGLDVLTSFPRELRVL